MVALDCLPLLSTTVMSPPLAASATTWLLVTMWPWSSSTQPDPVPSLVPDLTSMVTTLGMALAAMLAIDPAGRVVAPAPAVGAGP